MHLVVSRRLILVPVVAILAGCDVGIGGHLTARATDEWTHTYPLKAGGELRISNTNGLIEIEGVDGSTLEVRAERIARGVSDEAARELLPRIVIKEDATPERVSLSTERFSGIMLGAGFEVRYHVKAPKNSVVDVTNTNGQVRLNGLSGRVNARTTNGGVRGEALAGEVEARSTNGGVVVDLASVSSGHVKLHTANGGVTLTLPETAKADLSASVVNGGISIGEFQGLDVAEKTRRRFEARLNGGGSDIELQTTNGGIRIRPRSSVADTDKDDGRVTVLKDRKNH